MHGSPCLSRRLFVGDLLLVGLARVRRRRGELSQRAPEGCDLARLAGIVHIQVAEVVRLLGELLITLLGQLLQFGDPCRERCAYSATSVAM